MGKVQDIPTVVVVGLASCFGCQINVTNIEKYLLDVLGQIDMKYWQLTSSDPMPSHFDVAVIEGAVTTTNAIETVKHLRKEAASVITIGACAKTAGIPGMASYNYNGRAEEVYGSVPQVVEDIACTPCAVKDIIDVDFEVSCCPIDPYDFVKTLQHALIGSNSYLHTSTLCGQCKVNERGCFYTQGKMCLGLVTQSGCGARCPALGRPCSGCAGLSSDANIALARNVATDAGISGTRFDKALEIFNQTNLADSEISR